MIFLLNKGVAGKSYQKNPLLLQALFCPLVISNK
jgi:hypothetical protein